MAQSASSEAALPSVSCCTVDRGKKLVKARKLERLFTYCAFHSTASMVSLIISKPRGREAARLLLLINEYSAVLSVRQNDRENEMRKILLFRCNMNEWPFM